MRLTLADWSVVALYFLFNIAVGLYYKSRASRDTAEFFLSGRNVPWWLAGTSMVATTFAADTPLVVTGLAARRRDDRHRVLGDSLCRRAGRVPPGLPGDLPGPPHQLHHPRLGQACDGEDPPAGLHHLEGRGPVDRGWDDRADVRDLDALGPVGRAGDRSVSVRDQDGHGDRPGGGGGGRG